MTLQRLATSLTAIWIGIMIGVGYVFTPILFKMLSNDKPFARQIAGEAFTAVAYVSLVLGVIIMAIIRRENARAELTAPSGPLYLILLTTGLAVIAHFIVTPELVLAKTGVHTQWSFATLHLIFHIIYAGQILMLLALHWLLYQPIVKETSLTTQNNPTQQST